MSTSALRCAPLFCSSACCTACFAASSCSFSRRYLKRGNQKSLLFMYGHHKKSAKCLQNGSVRVLLQLLLHRSPPLSQPLVIALLLRCSKEREGVRSGRVDCENSAQSCWEVEGGKGRDVDSFTCEKRVRSSLLLRVRVDARVPLLPHNCELCV